MEMKNEIRNPSEKIRKKIEAFQKAEELLEKNQEKIRELIILSLKGEEKNKIKKELVKTRKEIKTIIKILLKEIKDEEIKAQLRFNLNWINKKYSEKTYDDLWSACVETSFPLGLVLPEIIETEIMILKGIMSEMEKYPGEDEAIKAVSNNDFKNHLFEEISRKMQIYWDSEAKIERLKSHINEAFQKFLKS